MKRYLEKHKDEINAKRREKRKKLKNLEEIDSYQANTKTFEEGNLTSQTESIPTEQKTICPTNYVRNKVSVVDAESALSANQPKNITVRVTRVHHPVQPILTQDVILRFDK